MHKQPTLAEMLSALAAAKLPPREHFDRMVQRGIVNRRGQLTKLFGGEAEPEQDVQNAEESLGKPHQS